MPPLTLFAAGSLKDPLGEIATAFGHAADHPVATTFGPSGLLCDRILAGAEADVFASADRDNPARLADAGRAGPPEPFARNWMCALIRREDGLTQADLLQWMCDDGVRLATSTPGNDPCGDYALDIFDKAERLRPGAAALLRRKALRLTGGDEPPAVPAGENPYGWLVAKGEADIFLTYVTNALSAVVSRPELELAPLPPELATSAHLHLCVIAGAAPGARALADWILGTDGRSVLRRYGFDPPVDHPLGRDDISGE